MIFHLSLLLAMAALLAVSIAPFANAHDSRWLSDGKISTGPKSGFLFSCQQSFNKNAPGANRTGSWLKGNKYHPHDKIHVEGSVNWPNAKITISTENG